MSAEDYYAKVEKNNVEKTINSTTQYMEMMQTYLKEMAKDGVGYEYSIKGTIDPSVAESAGYSELSSLELKMDINSKSNLAKISYETFLNDTALISADILADIENSKAYMQVKELSDKYLSLPFDTAYEDSELSDFSDYYASIDYAQFQEALENFDLDKDTQKRILERYSNVIIDSIKDVSLDKGVKVSVEDTSSKQTKIECKIDTDDMKKMLANIIASAKTDKDIMKLLVDNGVCTENDYTSALAIAEAYISSYDVSDIEMEPITMIVWVDNKGIITGREFDFSTSEENVSLGSQTSTKGDKTAYKLWATEADSTSISLTGSHTTKDKLVTGSCKLDINDAMVGPINIKYTNLGVKDFMASGYTGNIAITNPYIVGGSINIDLDYKDKTSFMNLTYNNQDKDLFTLNMSYAKKPFEEVQLPSDDQVYDIDDETDMSNYMAESKVEEYFQYLSDNFSWLDSYISQYKDTIMNSIYGNNDPYDDYDEYDDGYDDYDDEYDDDIESEDTSSVEADYDEIMAAGVPSNGLTTLGVKGADLSASLQSTYFADGFYDTDEYMSNTVSTYDNTEYTYYTTYNSFYYDDTYSNSLQMVSDTVNNDLYSVTFWDNDYDRFESMIMDTLAYVNPSISDSDLEAVRAKLTELYDSGTAGDIELDTIYLSIDKYDTSYYCDISYNNMP
ncbi:MAG TPA: hypothetical protein VHP81_12050 [Lachnospiraceae bacterium]|nr:hypothetical protein [Lachnospiraceae bacterium]